MTKVKELILNILRRIKKMVTIIDLNPHLKKLNGILKKETKTVEEKPAPKKRGRPAKKKEKNG
jgi:hypothetical protein